ncbi:MAG: FG-GAP repeat protein [Chlamydiae bacterium]|nr:FG-GAP repeat protein [Chlamydiota bacterium]MBI3277985.1 FG-GAP repeat protein [Chlamydiota bacterium]
MKINKWMGKIMMAFFLALTIEVYAEASEYPAYKLQAQDVDYNNSFGATVSIDKNYAVVGAPYDIQDGLLSVGAAYVYEKQADGSWMLVTKLVPPEVKQQYQYFGSSVSVSGSTLFVGAYAEDISYEGDPTAYNEGAVYVYERISEGEWKNVQKLVTGQSNYQEYGAPLFLDGDQAMVSANYDTNEGSIYAYKRSKNGSWVSYQKIKAKDDDSDNSDRLGRYNVCFSGKKMVVGNPFINNYYGGAYIFTRTATRWLQTASVYPETQKTFTNCGYATGISGNVIAIGEFSEGKVYIYNWDETAWSLVQELSEDGSFGQSISMSGNRMLVGVPNSNSQLVYLYRLVEGQWVEENTYDGGSDEGYFGEAVEIRGTRAIIGASTYPNDIPNGAAYIVELEE